MKASTIKYACFLGGMAFVAGLVIDTVERLKEDCPKCYVQMGPTGPVAHLHCGHTLQLNPESNYRIGAQHLNHDCSKQEVNGVNVDEVIEGLQATENWG